MKIKAVILEADEGYLAEVPATSGCATQGETLELLQNLYEADEGWLAIDIELSKATDKGPTIEIAL
jgi:predicted RNase H-like HicB family nuclease